MSDIELKDLLYKVADDQLILGHRNSEWTGIGPLLEEDIAFSSMAQDKVGHSLAFYNLLHQLGESEPDIVAFTRNAEQFHNSKFVELPIGEYDFSLIRHFLFDHAELIRFEMLSNSSHEGIAKIAKKLKGEVKYHVIHADSMIKQLGSSTTESIERMQKALNFAMPYALGLFEVSEYEEKLISNRIYAGEVAIKDRWIGDIQEIIMKTSLELPDTKILTPEYGGRKGEHTEHLQPLLEEMSAVFREDPTADW
ncbi:MAG: 1,2-phenylacetyl-CoA epoxidase subunit PaaC [Bacteroidota bacterium]